MATARLQVGIRNGRLPVLRPIHQRSGSILKMRSNIVVTDVVSTQFAKAYVRCRDWGGFERRAGEGFLANKARRSMESNHVVAFRWLKMWFPYAVCVGTQAILPMTIGLGIYLLFTNQPWWVLLGVQIIVAPIGVLASIMAATAAWLKVSGQRRLRRANSRMGQDH